ncbi:hypothetical protein [Halorientalis salina]|uniref:hypothetical protein n=1 Tax=Halorientalis salina TaxID=2932266 RepID=UPI0010AC20D6|nr:hypothetical protein [Halorientalis salina]
MIIYISGAFIIASPGIVYIEKLHKPGRLLRALEKLEADEIERSHCGFELMKEEINSIVDEEEQLSGDVHKLDVYAGTVTTGKGALLKVRAHIGENDTRQIEDPLFIKIRYQLDRTIRRGKTKIRTVGICFMLVGFTLQMWPDLTRVFSLVA